MRPSDLQDCREHLASYYLAMNAGYRCVNYQLQKIIPHLEAIERGELKRVMFWIPPGHAKSDLATRTFIPWFLGKHPATNSMVVSYSADLAAKDFGAKIKARMESPLYREIFSRAHLTRDSRAKDMFTTISGGTFYAAGFDGSLSGKRVDLMVIDDPLKNREEAESESRLTTLIDTYDDVIKTRLRPGAPIIICLTRYTTRDFAGRVLDKEGTVEKGGDWTVIKLKAEDPPGHYLWEDFYGRKHYEDAKRNEDSWHALWQQEPQAMESYWFRPEWLNYYDIPPPPGKFNTYMFVDPAASKSSRSDKTSIHVWAAAQDERLLLVDWVLDRLDPGDRTAAVMRLLRRWHPEQFIYEEYGLLNDTYYLTRQMEAEGWSGAYPIPVGKSGPRHNLSKDARIKAIIPLFREGKIWLPKKFEVRLSNGTRVDLTKRFVDDEYSLFKGEGTIAHEDDLDNMSRLMETPPVSIEYATPESGHDHVPRGRPSGGWEAVW